MLHTISKGALKVVFDDALGEVCAIHFNNRPVLKEPTYGSWQKSWPIMFPICGKLKDGKYLHQGKEYELPGHGFFRSLTWEVEMMEDGTALRAEATNTEEFINVYPFAFGIVLELSIEKDAFVYSINVQNKGEGPMYYNTGHHGAFMVDPSTYHVFFDSPISFKQYMATGEVGSDLGPFTVFSGKELDLDSDCSYQTVDSKAHHVTLRSGKGYVARLHFETFNVFTLWARPKSDWLCLEPWNGTQDIGNIAPREISQKPFIRKLDHAQSRSDTLIVKFENE